MKTIHIRNVPESAFEALKRLARLHRHSLEAEVRDVLRHASRRDLVSDDDDLGLAIVKSGWRTTLHRGEIYRGSGR